MDSGQESAAFRWLVKRIVCQVLPALEREQLQELQVCHRCSTKVDMAHKPFLEPALLSFVIATSEWVGSELQMSDGRL